MIWSGTLRRPLCFRDAVESEGVRFVVNELLISVAGYPPAKSEATSMLGAGHSHGARVVTLLHAARVRALETGFDGFALRPIGLELTLRCVRDRDRGDATNYLGGVADVLEDKSHRGPLEHLGELAVFSLYRNDRQIEEVRYCWEPAMEPSYALRLWALTA